MWIGALNAIHDVTDGRQGNQLAITTALLHPDHTDARRGTGRVVEGWIISTKGVWSTQRHKYAIACRRDIHKVRRRVTAHRAHQAKLIHY